MLSLETIMPITKSEMIRMINVAWAEYETCLAGFTDKQMTDLFDAQGWNVRDHITHLAAWEEMIAMLIQGKQRFQFLGVDSTELSAKPIDELNVVIREHKKNLPITAAIADYRRAHQALMASLQTLTDADLSQPAGKFFSQIPQDDPRRVVDIIQDNADRHISEHLPWIKTLVGASG
jgi:hypothetical protein